MLSKKNRQQIQAPRPGLFSRIKIFRIFFKVWFFDGLNREMRFMSLLSFRNAVVALLLFALAVPGYAYGSSNVVKGSLLYSMKRGIEDFEYNLVFSEKEKQEKEIKFAERRLDEVGVMMEKENDNIIETINETEEIFIQVNSNSVPQEVILDKYVKKITSIAQEAGLDNEPLTDSLATAIAEVKKTVNPKKIENLENKKNDPVLIEGDIVKTEIDISKKVKELLEEYSEGDVGKLKKNLDSKMEKTKEAVVE